MKTSKSPESAEVTPSKKKFKQARLPFKLISEVSPAPVTPPSRKRKLSSNNADPAPKIGKITKENDIIEVISDDDSITGRSPEKMPNPYVKLVDTAFKKKQKSKAKAKRSSRKKSETTEIGSVETGKGNANNDCVKMEVDEPVEGNDGAKNVQNENKTQETETVNKSSVVVVLEDSNSSVDVKLMETKISPEIAKSKEKTKPEHKSASTDSENSLPDLIDDINLCKSDKPDMGSVQCAENNKSEVESETLLTPKRSARNKAQEENNNKGTPSKLNESATSDPTTPRESRSSSLTKLDQSTPSNITPKQLQKKLESAKKREKLELEKQERERKRQEEKEERAKQRQEKEDQKRKEREEKEDQKKKEREEKEELRKKEKEEKEKQKELEKKQKEEKEELKRKEKEEKEEQRKKEKEAKEEEKRKRQDALDLEKLEQEAKKKKAAEAFANFFVPKQKVDKDQTVGAVHNSMLSSFNIKVDMKLAPTTRTQLSEAQVKTLERLMKEQNVGERKLYVKSLKNGQKPLSSGRTWPLSDCKDDDVILVEDGLPPESAGEIIACDLAPRETLRPKLFSFHENRRPPYWGTWRKKSDFVKPRNPFGQDEKQLDYEVDSDDDWEDDAEGESLDGSAAGSDDEAEPNDEYEVDNEVFVPHGYLSDEEATMDEDDVLSLSPEAQKARLKHLEDEFESEMKKPTEKLKPRMYGLLWESSDGGKPENCVDAIWNYFGKLSMIMNDPTPLLQPSNEPEEADKKKVKKKKTVAKEEGGQSPKSDKKKKPKTVEEKEQKQSKPEKKNAQDTKKNQPVINMFLKKIQS